ncbi:unnamed protein product [Mytilus coruscus]|uniref:Uncharacterized protein n=1 Tax=Mytilus coruscus TaxID=42192 RepID=A0A6J8AB01_MYTCO|nr:unnamed protein product [Mytilus coruscus]
MGFDEEAVARKRQGLQFQKIISLIQCATQDGASYPIIGASPIYIGVYGILIGCMGIIANSMATESITTQEETAKQRNLWNGLFGLTCASFGILGYPTSEVIRGATSCGGHNKECGNSHQDTLMALFIVAAILMQTINCCNIILLCTWRKFRSKTSQGPCVMATCKTSPKYT